MDHAVGAFEAKAQLSRLLRAVEQGEQFTITVRGRPSGRSGAPPRRIP